MYINPNTFETSEYQLEGMVSLIMEDPEHLDWYTIHSDVTYTIKPFYMAYTYYQLKHLDTLKRGLIEDINNSYEVSMLAGINYSGHTYDSDEQSLFRLLAAYTFAVNNPAYHTTWIAKDNQVIALTNSDVVSLGMTAMSLQTTLIVARRVAKDAVLACTTLEELIAVGLQ